MTNLVSLNLGVFQPAAVAAVKATIFTKGAVIQSPSAGKTAIWRAPFACTVTNVRGYQDVGTGSVVTADDGTSDFLVTDLTIGSAATWLDGGAVKNVAVAAGDTIFVNVVSVAGAPNYIAIQIDFTQP